MKPGINDPAGGKTHHRTGLISCALAIVTGSVGFLLFIVSMIPESGTYTARRWTNIFFIFAFAVAPALHICGLGLGIAGAFIKTSKKLFPTLGIVLNAVPLVGALLGWMLLFWVIWAVISSGGGWM